MYSHLFQNQAYVRIFKFVKPAIPTVELREYLSSGSFLNFSWFQTKASTCFQDEAQQTTSRLNLRQQLPTTKVEVFLEDLLASKVYFIRIPV